MKRSSRLSLSEPGVGWSGGIRSWGVWSVWARGGIADYRCTEYPPSGDQSRRPQSTGNFLCNASQLKVA
jgi:hypothetical protein